MLTKIRSLIQEIRDIKQGKSNNIKTNLPEISRSPHKGSPALLSTSDKGDLRGVYLIDIKPTHYCQSDNNNKTPQYEEPLIPDTPAPTPSPPSPPHTTPPDPSRSSGVSYVSSEPSLEDDCQGHSTLPLPTCLSCPTAVCSQQTTTSRSSLFTVDESNLNG